MKLKGEVLQSLKFGEITVILLDEGPKKDAETLNVVGIDNDNNVIWKVESPFLDYGIKNNIPFTLLSKVNENELIITNFYGVRYKISSKTGKIILKEEVTK